MARAEWTVQLEWMKQFRYDDPELRVTLFSPAMPYAVAVELRSDEEGPFVTGIAVRRDFMADGWEGERTHVPPRDVQRLPLSRIVRAALAAARSAEKPPSRVGEKVGPFTIASDSADPRVETSILLYDYRDDEQRQHFPPAPGDPGAAARKVMEPNSRPNRNRKWYGELAEVYQEAEARGLSPAKEIARQTGANINTVYQWIHRMRHDLGLLDPPPRSRRKEQDDG